MDYYLDKAGIYDIPFQNYTSQKKLTPTPWLSSGTIKTMLNKSPKHAAYDHPDLGGAAEQDSTKAAGIGTIAHSIILKQEDSRIAVSPFAEFRTNEAKAWRDEQLEKGMVIVKKPDMQAALDLAKSFITQINSFQYQVGEIFPIDKTEKTVVAEIEGVWCKIRIDSIGAQLWDLKSTGVEMTPEKWIKNQLYGNGYDIQVEFYRRVFKAATGEQKRMILAVIEQKAPYDCYPVILSDLSDDLAQQKVDWALKTWRAGLETGHWDGYSSGRLVHAFPPTWELADWELFKQRQETISRAREQEAAA